ncbi:MAG: formylmethanofuran dehydrogenase subunit A [Candidatus Altiarchaeales archaeon HGW-Altiarchaeales-3]|nr:MAG: formylmethanofuran dehydrogenase subunit A [Candidatus Altiarchaeales archaeon HGW-Altiarchaeales-3]
MTSLIIKNGFVYDPLNKINGEIMDISIENGKVVEKISDERTAKVIDARGKTVMPGGVDSHSHIAGAKVNTGRIMRPEDSRRHVVPKTKITQSGTGETVPTVAITGYEYAAMGYTTVMEAAMPPLEAIHTHEEMLHIPIIDKGAYEVFGNNWFVMKYLKEGDIEKAAAYVAWLLRTTKGYGIKIVNPAGVEAWGWGKNVESLDENIDNFDINSREIVKGLAEVNEMLNLPMSIHLHANNLGKPGNHEITKDSLKIVKNIKVNTAKNGSARKQNIYLAHAQFNSFGGNSWSDFESGTKGITNYLNAEEHVVIDLGAVPFGNATVMTGDGPSIHELFKLMGKKISITGNKWSNKDIEVECGSGVIPFKYLSTNPIHSIQWAMGLELALYTDDLNKIIMTTDHPNGGPFSKYPKVITWLMSSKAREDTMKLIHKFGVEKTRINATDRELSLYDIATVTRATPAMVIGLADRKGHLGVGADGDVTIYDINPAEFNSANYKEIEEKFSKAAYTIKDGIVVAENGLIKEVTTGRTFWVDKKVGDDIEKEVLKDIKKDFVNYTLNFENYGVDMRYLSNSTVVN